MFATQLQKEYVHMDENTYKSMRLKVQSLIDNQIFSWLKLQ